MLIYLIFYACWCFCHRDVWRCENVCLWPKNYWDLLPGRLQNHFWPKWLGFVGEAAKSCYIDCPPTVTEVRSASTSGAKPPIFWHQSDHSIYYFDNNLVTIFIILTTTLLQNSLFGNNLVTTSIILTIIGSQFWQQSEQGNYSLRRPPKLIIPQIFIEQDGLLYKLNKFVWAKRQTWPEHNFQQN